MKYAWAAVFAGFVLLFSLPGCAHRARPVYAPDVVLERFDPPGGASLRELTRGAPWTVLVFFSAHCPCQRAHDARLIALDARYRTRGVQLVLVDSEIEASAERDRKEAHDRGYPFPLLLDREGALASALGADYATYAVILGRDGRVYYRGGLDSDRSHLRADARPYLSDALDDLLSGHAPKVAETKTLGCALRRR